MPAARKPIAAAAALLPLPLLLLLLLVVAVASRGVTGEVLSGAQVVPMQSALSGRFDGPHAHAEHTAVAKFALELEAQTGRALLAVPQSLYGGMMFAAADTVSASLSPLAPAAAPLFVAYSQFNSLARDGLLTPLDNVFGETTETTETTETATERKFRVRQGPPSGAVGPTPFVLDDDVLGTSFRPNVPESARRIVSGRRFGSEHDLALALGGDVFRITCPLSVLDAAGLGTRTPSTWEEMEAVMRAGKAMGMAGITASSLPVLATQLLVAMHGGAFAQDAILGEVDMTDARLLEWMSFFESLVDDGLLSLHDVGADMVDVYFAGAAGCFSQVATFYAELGMSPPPIYSEPFALPIIPSETADAAGVAATKSEVGSVFVSFAPAKSLHVDDGIAYIRYSVNERYKLMLRGGPFSDEELTLLGPHMLYFERELIAAEPQLATALANHDRISNLDFIVPTFGIGSPTELVSAYSTFFDRWVVDGTVAPIAESPADLLSELETLRVQVLLGQALAPLADVESGRFDDDVTITFASATPGARIRYSLNEPATLDSPVAADGRIVVSASGTTTVRAIATAEKLSVSEETTLTVTIERPNALAVILPSVIGGLVLLLLVVGIAIIINRNKLQLVPASDVKTHEIIGIGGRSIVYRGTYRGVEVAVKEFLSRADIKRVVAEAGITGSAGGTETGSLVTSAHSANKSPSGSATTAMLRTSATSDMHKTGRDRGSRAREFRAEVRTLTKVRHPNIVTFLAAFEEGQRRGVVLEFMPRGSLYDVLSNNVSKISWRQRVGMMRDGSRGLAYLHAQSPPILHHDVKSLNLLVNESGQVAVSDFGQAKEATGGAVSMATLPWAAPEVVRGEAYTAASDVYSFGMVMWEIASRTDPVLGRSAEQIRADSMTGWRPTIDAAWPEQVTKLMEQCWAENPLSRPSFSEVVDALGEIFAEMPHEKQATDTRSIACATTMLGTERMRELQSVVLDGTIPPAVQVDDVAVLFTDIVGFTAISSKLSPVAVAELIKEVFGIFDTVAAKWGVAQYQTVGDAYIAVTHQSMRKESLPSGGPWNPATAMCGFALEITRAVQAVRVPTLDQPVSIRAGIHCGPIAFHVADLERVEILGDTVNMASRMESTGTAGRVQVTMSVYETVRSTFTGVKRRGVEVKGKGEITTVILDFVRTPSTQTLPDPTEAVAPAPQSAALPGLANA